MLFSNNFFSTFSASSLALTRLDIFSLAVREAYASRDNRALIKRCSRGFRGALTKYRITTMFEGLQGDPNQVYRIIMMLEGFQGGSNQGPASVPYHYDVQRVSGGP